MHQFWVLALVLAARALECAGGPLGPRAALTTTTRPLKPFPGNRTHYSSGLPREGSDLADPLYRTTASGSVTILTDNARSTAPHAAALKAAHATWGNSQNINVQWQQYGEGTEYREHYVNEVLDACEKKMMGGFDVVWVRADQVGNLAECLEDLWSWNEAMAVEHGGVVARGGLVNDRLVAVPAELSFGIMLYNLELLQRYGYVYPPATMNELEEMATAVLAGERVLENFRLSGWTGPLTANEDLTSVTTEWLAGMHASILSDTGNITIATTQTANFFARITSWIEAGILSIEDIGTLDMAGAIDRFFDKRSIFLRTTTQHVPSIVANPPRFTWGIAPVPSQLESGLGVGTAEGWFVGVYKYSTNKAAAVKTAEWLTSQDYQKDKILDLGAAMVGTYPNFLLDRAVCNEYGTVSDVSLCGVYSQVSLTRRPVTQSGKKYEAVSTATQNAVLDVMTGKTYIITALVNLDATLRSIMGYPPQVVTIAIDDNVVIVRPGKKTPEKVGTQLAGLCVIATVTGVVVTLLRRKQRKDMERELMAGNQQANQQGAAAEEMQQTVKEGDGNGKGKGRANEEDHAEDAALIQKSDKIEI
ncbi:hypothetical protein PhCBS80983_g00021 [Powellomyces hirtus]|uniref:Uncharacterized protein n=1 Tax=Powellomyces hirtus TaxID=109895 RepID=A0A507EHD2_9FUNG|nr:hypothetical protein PhCBS80983_g00021 [Powellomyces hirtus]